MDQWAFGITWLGHAAKKVAGQLCSPIRTLMFGDWFCDAVHARSLGMPTSAFARSSPMSDYLNCILFNPYYVVADGDTLNILQSYVL